MIDQNKKTDYRSQIKTRRQTTDDRLEQEDRLQDDRLEREGRLQMTDQNKTTDYR